MAFRAQGLGLGGLMDAQEKPLAGFAVGGQCFVRRHLDRVNAAGLGYTVYSRFRSCSSMSLMAWYVDGPK